MSLFNSQNILSLIFEHEDLLSGHRLKDGVSGVMFYNNECDEREGLIYGSEANKLGEVTMGMILK